MSRLHKSAIIISSDEQSGNDTDHSDYSPEEHKVSKKKKTAALFSSDEESEYIPKKPKVDRKRKLEEVDGVGPSKPNNTEGKRKTNAKRKLKEDDGEESKPKKSKATSADLKEKDQRSKPSNEKKPNTTAPKKELNTVKEKSDSKQSKAKSDKQQVNYNENEFWSPSDVISAELGVESGIARNVVNLLEEGNSLPFLARYRREATGGMGPDVLRQVKEHLDILKEVKEKCKKVMTAVDKVGKLNPGLKLALMRSQSLPELDHLYGPYKTGSKASLAERARKLGLEPLAMEVVNGSRYSWDLANYVVKGTKGKETVDEIKAGLQHIIADIIVHDPPTTDVIRDLQKRANICVEAKKAKVVKSDAKDPKKQAKPEDVSKFENYFDFSCSARFIKPHQVLALNRGENLKVLSIKVNIPDWFHQQLEFHVRQHWRLDQGKDQRTELILLGMEDGFKRLVIPLIQRQTRASLTKMAEDASITVFLENLRRLLLSPPCRGTSLLAIDPGFSHGCKIAVLSASGDMVEHAVIYPNFRSNEVNPGMPAVKKLVELVNKYEIPTIAIGNGTACRETETMVSSMITSGMFGGRPSVKYTIVSEQGASIYSCSPAAATEFPGLDTNVVSAVSIGRRLQDPLSELVKIEPQHLGVGMYQHDLTQSKLKTALDEVVVECVSFVGVDINSCSQHLLNRVAGLNSARAKAIVEWRQKNGDFVTREQLKKVKGVGDKVFQQCAGFVRVVPRKGGENQNKIKKNMLDTTQIHPESYSVAEKLVARADCRLNHLGSPEFIKGLEMFARKVVSLEKLAGELCVGLPTVEMILQALQHRPDYDMRAEFSAPLFKSGMTKMEDLKKGDVLTGRVTNVTHFGAFVDIGVGPNGLVHTSKNKGHKLELGQRLEVKVENVEVARKRIGLELVKLIV